MSEIEEAVKIRDAALARIAAITTVEAWDELYADGDQIQAIAANLRDMLSNEVHKLCAAFGPLLRRDDG